MKIKITESQYKFLLSEQNTPKKIGCRDYDSIEKFCTTLVFPKSECDMLIAKHKPTADKKALNLINSLEKELLTMGGKEGQGIAKTFSSSINKTKSQIFKILTPYYTQSMYASCGLGPLVNVQKIILDICGLIYSNFIKEWNDSYVYKNIARVAVTKSNINKYQLASKDILIEIINSIYNMVDDYFLNSGLIVSDYVYEKEKTTPKCSNVIIVQTKGCDPLPKAKWYSPNQKYKNIGISTPSAKTSPESQAINTYLPKLTAFLNELV